MNPDKIVIQHSSSPPHVQALQGIFHEPSANGELAPPPQTPGPSVPVMPHDWVPPSIDEHLQPDAHQGASKLS